MKELKLEEMTLEQKIGQLFCIRWLWSKQDIDDICAALSKGALGGIQLKWKEWFGYQPEEVMARFKEAADYNVLICADMERGFPGGQVQLPNQMAISYAGEEELAYEFARVTAVEAKNAGYNVVWGPVVGVGREGRSCINARNFGSLEETIRCSIAMLKGYQDQGMIATMKHFPGSGRGATGDSHMQPTVSESDLEDLMNVDMKPYFEAVKSGDLAGIMTTHRKHPKVDDKPSTMSSKILGVLRDKGFDGIIFSDSLAMMAIESVYGKRECLGQAIAAGVDMVLPSFSMPYRECHDALMESYQKGVFSEERLNDAVRHVLAAQKRTMAAPTQTELNERQKGLADELSAKSLCAILKDGVEPKLDPNKKKLFVLLHETNPSNSVSQELDDHRGFLKPQVENKACLIQEAFPDAKVMLLNEFPNNAENTKVLSACSEADEVIFFTFCTSTNHQGSNNLTIRMKSVLNACMYKMAAIVHLGNPYEMRPFLAAPRIFLGLIGSDSERYAIKALKGEFVPTGKAPTDL